MKKRKMQKPIETILVDTNAWLNDEYYTYEEYCEECEMNEFEPKDEGSEQFFQWRLNHCNDDVECDLDNIRLSKMYNDRYFIITGSLGLWNGRPNIEPVKMNNLYDAIQKCFGRCDDIKVVLNNKTGVIEVYASHHDGTNCFEIRQLRDYCVNAYERAEANYNYGDDDEFILKDGWFQKIKNLYWD